MDNKFAKKRYELFCKKILSAFEKRHFEGYYADNKEDALNIAKKLISKDDCISWGGSLTTKEVGLIDYITNNNYKTLNRDVAQTKEDKDKISRQAFCCDTYIMGTNAITEDGELINVDCIGNRVGALMFGPKNVIVIVGRNKICKNKEEAIKRAREVAAPINMQRIAELSGRETPCTVDGTCHDCKSENSICSNIVITRLCYPAKRIKVILVNEDLGF